MNFCSRASIDAHEQFAGTGVRGEAYVFLPVAKRVWHDKEMNSHWASREELQAIQLARKSGVVTRLYNPPAEKAEGEAPVLVHTNGRQQSEGLQTYLQHFASRWPIDDTGRPRLAICTHGTRDRCCAKFGFAAFQAARKLYESGASLFEPVESSHLGGDRFAATGLFFPSGSMYAHLDQVDLAALCSAEAAGQLIAEHYRGGAFDPQLVQLVRAGLARDGHLNDTSAAVALTSHGPLDLEADIGGRRFHVRLKSAEVEFFGSCSALHTGKPSRGRRLVFERAEPLDAAERTSAEPAAV